MHSRHKRVRVIAAQLFDTTELWVAFGTRKVFWHLAAHGMDCNVLGVKFNDHTHNGRTNGALPAAFIEEQSMG